MSGIMQMLLGGQIHDPFIANVVSTQYFNSLTDQQGSTWTLTGSGMSISGGQLVDPNSAGSGGWATLGFSSITGDFTLEFDYTCGTNNTTQWNSTPSYRQNVCCMGSSEQYYGIAINKTGSIAFWVDGTYVVTTGVVLSFPTGLCRFTIERSGLNNYLYLNGALIATISPPYKVTFTTLQMGISMTGQSGFQFTADTFDNVRLTTAARYSGSSYALPAVPYPYS